VTASLKPDQCPRSAKANAGDGADLKQIKQGREERCLATFLGAGHDYQPRWTRSQERIRFCLAHAFAQSELNLRTRN
jgi:hypothetical protein